MSLHPHTLNIGFVYCMGRLEARQFFNEKALNGERGVLVRFFFIDVVHICEVGNDFNYVV